MNKTTDAISPLEEILERITDAFVALDKNWCYTYVNKRAGEILHRDPKEIIGKHIWTEFPEGVGQPFHKAYEQAMAEQKYIYLEEYFPPFDKWFENHIYPSPDGLSIYFRDVTEKKKQELKMKASEAKYRSVVENIHEALMIDNKEGDLVYVNNEFSKIFGYSADEFKNLSLKDYTSPESYSEVFERHTNRMKGQKVAEEFEYKGIRKDGTEIWMEARVSLVMENGKIVGTHSLERDITERKKAEELHINNLRRLNTAQKLSKTGSFEFNLETLDLTWSEEHYRIFELEETAPDKLWNVCRKKIHPDDIPAIDEAIKIAIEKSLGVSLEHRIICHDGSIKYLLGIGEVFKSRDGKSKILRGAVQDITERKKAEAKIVEKELQYRTLVEHASDGIFITDLNEHFLDVNSSASKLTGFTKDELLSMKVDDLVIYEANDPPSRLEEIREGKPILQFRKMKRKDGSIMPAEVSAKMLPDKRVLSIVRDITERKHSEEKIFESEERYRNFIEGTHDLVQSIGPSGEFLFVNKAWERILGYTEADRATLRLFDILHPESKQHCAELFTQGLKGNSIKTFEVTFIKKNGDKVILEGSADPRIVKGEVIATQSFFRDITERKQTESSLKLFRTLMDQSTDAIEILDPETLRILDVNETECRQLGYSREELLSLSIFDIDPTMDRATYNADALRKAGAVAYEKIHRRKDGTTFPVEVNIKYVEGEREYFIVVVRDITERKKAEEELAKRELQYRSLIEQASDAIMITDFHGNFMDVNMSMCAMLGYTKKELMNMNISVLVDPEQLKIRPINFAQLAAGQHVFSERRMLHRNGTVIEVEANVKKITEDRVLAIARDITERKKTEEKLRKSETHLRTIVETEPECIKLLDANCNLLEMNPAGLAMIEADSLEQVFSCCVLDLINERHKNAFEKLNKDVFSGKSGTLQFEITGMKGTQRWMETHAVPMPDAEGKIIASLGITRDITERKKTEEKILKSEEQYRDLVDNITDLICTHDLDGKILSANSAAENLSGYKINEDHELNIKGLLANDTDDEFNRYIAAIKKDGHAKGRLKMKTPAGEIRIWEYNNSLKTVGVSTPIVRGYARDITERKKSEQEILQMNEQLRNLSSHLQNIREEERKKIAREIHDELGQQLTVIKMNLHSLLKKNKKQDPEFTEKATAIGEYINQTMDTVRKISSELRPVILDDFGIADALQLHSSEFAKRTGIPCDIKVDGNEIVSDINISTQVFRIYQEALTNVARHSKATQVKSTLKSENGMLKILISDNGKGFNPEKVSGKKSLGLVMMRERAIGIGGTLEINSEPGKGTSVTFSLPLEK